MQITKEQVSHLQVTAIPLRLHMGPPGHRHDPCLNRTDKHVNTPTADNTADNNNTVYSSTTTTAANSAALTTTEAPDATTTTTTSKAIHSTLLYSTVCLSVCLSRLVQNDPLVCRHTCVAEAASSEWVEAGFFVADATPESNSGGVPAPSRSPRRCPLAKTDPLLPRVS